MKLIKKVKTVIVKKKEKFDLIELLTKCLQGFYVKKPEIVVKSPEERRKEFILFFKIKPFTIKLFFFFFKFNYKTLMTLRYRSVNFNIKNKRKILNVCYNRYWILILKNLIKNFRVDIRNLRSKKFYRLFLLNYFTLNCKILFPYFCSFEKGVVPMPNVSSVMLYRSMILLCSFVNSLIRNINVRRFFDLVVIKHNFKENFFKLRKNNKVYECFITLSRNNIFFTFFRVFDGKVIYCRSTGMEGFKGKKKKTPLSIVATAKTFAQVVISRFNFSNISLEDLIVNLSLFGPVSSMVIKEACKGLYKGGLRFNRISDRVTVEHSKGITRKKPRRV